MLTLLTVTAIVHERQIVIISSREVSAEPDKQIQHLKDT
jgi:hypothetical protein